jgi:LytS/YehU family sensor histidine kinase
MKAAMASKEPKNDFFLNFLTGARYRVFRHLLLLLLFFAGFYARNGVFTGPAVVYAKIFLALLLLSLFYLNMYLLIPRLLFKGRYLEYFLWIVCLFGIFLILFIMRTHWLKPYLKPHYIMGHESLNVFSFIFPFIVLLAASASVKLFQRWIADTRRINELETTTMQSELEQLKNQVNPHFLLNTLNNANVLTKKDPEKASQVLMKLSDLLRYQLYDSARQKVLLTADIHFLEDFLNLEKIRRDNFEFIISKEGDLSGVQIAPMLLITFAENAVKHNIDAEAPSYVHLFFNVKYNQLHFKCVNSKPQLRGDHHGSGGLGLANVKRRLELLYPGTHEIAINNDKETFSVDLTLGL